MRPPDRTADQVRIGPVRRLHLAMAGLILGLLLAVGAIVVRQHNVAIQETAETLRVLARVKAAETDRTFQAVERVLSTIAKLAVGLGTASFDAELGRPDVHLRLQGVISGRPQIDAVAIVNAEGRLVNFSRYWPIPKVDLSDRDYFKALQSRPDLQSFIGAPVQDRGTGTWTIHLARRLTAPGGGFAGVLLGSIQLDYFEQAYAEVSDGEGATLALVRGDNVLLAHYPPSDLIGRAFAEFGDTAAQTSHLRGRSPLDHKQRIEVAQSVARYPLLIRATLTEAEALREWRQEVLVLLLAAVALAVALGAAARALGRLWIQDARLARAEGERREAEAALESQRERLSTLDALQAAKEEAERLQAAAEAANHAKSAFLAMMSHELRTPLNAVIGFAEVMSMEAFGKLGNDNYREYTQFILESGRHLLSVINDILDLSKAEAEKIDLHVEAMDLSDLATDVCRLMQREASVAGLTLIQAAPAGDTVLRADPQRVRQILLNLVSNAIKFTADGGKITLAVIGGEKGVTLTVEDTGIGIAPADIAEVFRPFMQADSSLSRKREGTGLGLPLVRAMARLHGGDVTLHSDLGRGTIAEVFLPRLPPFRAGQPELVAAA